MGVEVEVERIGPNDVWPRPDGGLYFTDPFYKREWWKYSTRPQDSEQVYFLSVDRKTLKRVTKDLVQPNGIIGTPDGDLIPLTVDGHQTFLKDRKGNVVKSRLDEAALEKIATTTGGAYVHGEGPNIGLDEVYNTYIGKLEKRELKSAMERRFEEINNFEKYLVRNGIAVVKLFLNVSKEEQKKRFLERIDD
jgi:hypothetical protein